MRLGIGTTLALGFVGVTAGASQASGRSKSGRLSGVTQSLTDVPGRSAKGNRANAGRPSRKPSFGWRS